MGWDANSLSLSADGISQRTASWDPPVEQNYTNRATTKNLLAHYERDFGAMDRLGLIVRRGQSMFLVPNEIVQQENGQRQDRTSEENLGLVSYTHVFSANILGELRGMVARRDCWPWVQRTLYARGGKSGPGSPGELRERISFDTLGNPRIQSWNGGQLRLATRIPPLPDHMSLTQFDDGTNPEFQFMGRAQSREQAVFANDLVRLKHWTFSAGLRFDHYRLLVDETAWSPRAGIAYYWPAADLVLRASYDRVFQTPAFENIPRGQFLPRSPA